MALRSFRDSGTVPHLLLTRCWVVQSCPHRLFPLYQKAGVLHMVLPPLLVLVDIYILPPQRHNKRACEGVASVPQLVRVASDIPHGFSGRQLAGQ